MNDRTNNPTHSRLPHRLATLLVCAVFPLIFVGGLVTTTEAGMAVPDWPSTFGYNLFLYPWTTWFFGPWDIFVEHGHRLLGAAAGFITIALAWSLWKYDERPWMKWLGVATLVGVVTQGVLGGMRVRLGEQTLALLHGCTGPLYFALCVAAWQLTRKVQSGATGGLSTRVRIAQNTAGQADSGTQAAKTFRLAVLTTFLAYLQLVLGAVVRHMPVTAAPGTFRVAVLFHLFMAAVLTVHVGLLVAASWKSPLRAAAALLGVLLVSQLALGAGTWVVNYGFPQWVHELVTTPNFVIRTHSLPQLLVTTAHVAIGSLILVTSLVLVLRSGAAVRRSTVGTSVFAGLALREALR